MDFFEKGSQFHQNFFPLLGNGIFASDGAKWRKQRKTASRLFTTRRLRDFMFSVFQSTSENLIHKIKELSANGDSVNMWDLFNRMTLDAFVESAFGYKMGNIDIAPEVRDFMTAFDESQRILVVRQLDRFWRIKRFLGVGLEASLPKYISTINALVREVIQNRFSKGTEQTRGDDFLSLFLKDDNLDDDLKTLGNLRDIILNFILAGKDTTAQTLSWMFYSMLTHPEVLAQAREEADSFQEIDFDAVQKMDYIHAVMSETVRLYPPVP